MIQARTSVKLCIQSPESQSFVSNCTEAFAAANSAAVEFSCVLGGSLEACTAMVEAGTATLTLMGGMLSLIALLAVLVGTIVVHRRSFAFMY